MKRTLEYNGMTLSLLEDGTWKLDNVSKDAQLSGEAAGRPVTRIAQYAFEYESMLQDIVLPEGIRSAETEAFMSRWAKRVWVPASMTDLDGLAFSHCPPLESIDVSPDNPCISSQDGIMLSKDGSRLLRFPPNRTGTTLRLPDSLVELASGSMAECWALLDVSIPGTVREIGQFAFRECERMSSVILEEGVKRLAPESFDGCYMLDYFRFPDSIESLGEESPFGNLGIIKHLRLPSWTTELPPWFSDVVEPSSLHILEAEGLTLDKVSSEYKAALTRGAAELYTRGIEPDEYAAFDFVVYAGDWRQVFMMESIDNESLRAYLLDHGVLTPQDVTVVAAEASKRGKVELAATLLEYAQMRMAKSSVAPRGLEL